MGLTRIQAFQISDIDYKQAVRVIATSNTTLSGGAPVSVDGVTLVVGDRVLVAGQNTGSQNGLYKVTTLGTGSNGTWARTLDGDTTGEIEAGMIVMVTEGNIYKDTQWKLTTDNPIVIGVTTLTFEQNSAFAFGNVYANGTAVLATTVGDTLTLTAGNNIAITGNATAKSVSIGVTGISLTSIANGTSNVNVVSSGGNVTVGVGGTGNVAVFSSTGANITGNLGVSGNVTGGNLTTAGQVVATGNVSGGNLNVTGNIIDTGALSIITGSSGNIALAPNGSNVLIVTTTGANIIGTLTATGNITGSNILGNGAGLTGINAFSTVAITGGNSAVADSIADTLTITAGTGIALVMDSATDTLTIAASGGSEIFVDGADFGTVTEPVTVTDELGLVTDAVTAEADLGALVTSGLIYPDQFVLPSYTTTTLPSASIAGSMIFVTNESGGSVPAFADGTNWRRVTDRAIVT